MTGLRAVAVLGIVSILGCHSLVQAAEARVRTESGWVEGVEAEGVQTFRGIPFAAPPVGDLRWRAPQPANSWRGVRKADKFSPVCLQHGSYPEDAPSEPQSEDCLYLNVWVPASSRGRKLPVMVWIYGGALQNGSASTPLYAGDQLARHGVIVVTANYRLGVFGFLAHPELTRESGHGASGNYGLQDQLAALRWVKRNAAAFGGDPDRVTVFGQSSGSISISALIASPLAKGLFQQAIGQSGALFEPMQILPDLALPGAERAGVQFSSRVSAANLAALRATPAEQLLDQPFRTNLIVDGYVLPRSPYEVFSDGQQNQVAILVGSNRDEGEFFIRGRTITVANMRAEVERDFPAFLVNLVGLRDAANDTDAHAIVAAFNRDIRFRWDMWIWARLSARAGTKVFAYEFSRESSTATHGAEMPYVFGHAESGWSNADRRLASAVAMYWTHFAKTGDPNGSGLPTWPAFTESTMQGMLLGQETRAGQPFDDPALPRIDAAYTSLRATTARK